MKYCIIIAVLYVFGIGWYTGNYSGYYICKEGRKVNDFESPFELIITLLVTPILAIFWSLTLFFKGPEGMESKK